MVQGTAAVGTRDWGSSKDRRSWLGNSAAGGCEGGGCLDTSRCVGLGSLWCAGWRHASKRIQAHPDAGLGWAGDGSAMAWHGMAWADADAEWQLLSCGQVGRFPKPPPATGHTGCPPDSTLPAGHARELSSSSSAVHSAPHQAHPLPLGPRQPILLLSTARHPCPSATLLSAMAATTPVHAHAHTQPALLLSARPGP